MLPLSACLSFVACNGPQAIKPAGAADQQVADESMAAVDQFLRNLPRHVEGLTFYNSHGDRIRAPKQGLSAEVAQAGQELAWVKFRQAYGDFISWTQPNSPSGADRTQVQRTDVFSVHCLTFTRDAVFPVGTVRIRFIVEAGSSPPGTIQSQAAVNPTGKPVIFTLYDPHSAGVPIPVKRIPTPEITITVHHPKFR
jgi:hypothetical protein